MASKIENQVQTKLDWLKWLVIAVLTVTGLAANYYYSQQPWPLRLIAGLAVIAIVMGIVMQTQQGIRALSFARDSRMELRKVVWPTRQETMQTTLIIAVMVVILALVLWGLDGILVSLIGWLTGQRG
jgi:preprotein translocase subunit SecE